MHSQRVKMDIVSQNLANAETTRTDEGTPYRRQRAVFSELVERQRGRRLAVEAGRGADSRVSRTHDAHLGGLRNFETAAGSTGVEVDTGDAQDASQFRVVYDPGHPDADDEGYVLMPNVNVVTEMVDMITATRAYEANVSAIQAAKDMFNKALEI